MNSSSVADTSPATVRVTGWRVGAQTVSAIQAIREASRLELADTKGLVECVLAGVPVVVNVDNAASAQELVSVLGRLGFEAHLVGR